MFLARQTPITGESLSSWRQRSGLANGFRLFPLAPGELRRLDPDQAPDPLVVQWLASQFMRPVDVVARLTLKQLDGRLLKFGTGRACPRWVVPLHYSRRDEPYGAPFCPKCLAHDLEPHFRIRWRLALESTCRIHAVLLIDQCPSCGHPGWPASTTIPMLYGDEWRPVHICPLCSLDLRTAPTHRVSPDPFMKMTGELFEGSVALGADLKVPAHEYAAALWAVCQLFVRTRSQRRILKVQSASADVARGLPVHLRHGPEYLPLRERHALVSEGHRLFSDWPSVFVSFCDAHDIAAEHLSADREQLPPWFLATIRAHVRRQARGITQLEVDFARQALMRKGEPINKSRLAKELGAVEVKLLQETMGRRLCASADERTVLLTRLRTFMNQQTRRISSTEMRARDVSMLLLAAASGASLDAVACWPEAKAEEVKRMVRESEPRPAWTQIVDLLEASLKLYTCLRTDISAKRSHLTPVSFFSGFRGGAAPARSAQKTLRICMNDLDARLLREPSILAVGLEAVASEGLAPG